MSMNIKLIGQFVFVNSFGRYVQSSTNGEVHAWQPIDNCGEEQRWNVYTWTDGLLSLQNYHTNSWLCAEPLGKAVCDRESPGPWARWTLSGIGDKLHVCLLGAHGSWLTAHLPGAIFKSGGEVAADRPNVGPWEAFSMIPAPGIQLHNLKWRRAVKNNIEMATPLEPILLLGHSRSQQTTIIT
jgi:hypothetical protein